jgi:hypothetical protein
MKGRTAILLLILACALVIGAAFAKVHHVGNAEYFLIFAMLFQVGVFGFIVYKNNSKRKRP